MQGDDVLEAKIEAAVCDYAKTVGFLVYKFTSPMRAAVPDRLFVYKTGDVFFIEFKRTGEKATPAQKREHLRLEAHKMWVWVVDDIDQGKHIVDEMADRFDRFEDTLT